MPQWPKGSRLAGAMASRQTALVLATLVMGINAAYLFRSDSTHAKLMTAAILVLLMLAVFARMKLNQEMAEDARDDSRQDAAPRRRFLFENGMLAGLLIISAWRIFG